MAKAKRKKRRMSQKARIRLLQSELRKAFGKALARLDDQRH